MWHPDILVIRVTLEWPKELEMQSEVLAMFLNRILAPKIPISMARNFRSITLTWLEIKSSLGPTANKPGLGFDINAAKPMGELLWCLSSSSGSCIGCHCWWEEQEEEGIA